MALFNLLNFITLNLRNLSATKIFFYISVSFTHTCIVLWIYPLYSHSSHVPPCRRSSPRVSLPSHSCYWDLKWVLQSRVSSIVTANLKKPQQSLCTLSSLLISNCQKAMIRKFFHGTSESDHIITNCLQYCVVMPYFCGTHTHMPTHTQYVSTPSLKTWQILHCEKKKLLS